MNYLLIIIVAYANEHIDCISFELVQYELFHLLRDYTTTVTFKCALLTELPAKSNWMRIVR